MTHTAETFLLAEAAYRHDRIRAGLAEAGSRRRAVRRWVWGRVVPRRPAVARPA